MLTSVQVPESAEEARAALQDGAVPLGGGTHLMARAADRADGDLRLVSLRKAGLGGIDVEGDTVTLAATDRYRFAVREFLWKPESPDASAVALVPAKTLWDTAKSLSGGETVALALSGSGAAARTGVPSLSVPSSSSKSLASRKFL